MARKKVNTKFIWISLVVLGSVALLGGAGWKWRQRHRDPKTLLAIADKSFAEGKFEVGSPVEFDITLPAEFIGAKKDVKIRCQGRVVRAGDHPNRGSRKEKAAVKKNGVAFVIDSYEFVRK